MFTKKDLRSGDVCIQRSGDVMIYIDCFNGVFVRKDNCDTVKGWNDNLCGSDIYDDTGFFDIMKVYRPEEPYQCQFSENEYTKGRRVFDRKRDNNPILDKDEREYLSAVIKPFINSVSNITKVQLSGQEYIRVSLNNLDSIFFPRFQKGTMYRNMKPDKPYTLYDLGL